MRAALTPEQVIDAAVDMIERDGAANLSMRKLAAELGVSANTIYWHVGGREKVLEAVIARVSDRQARVRVQGDTPRERVLWVARRVWKECLANHQVAVLAHDRGHTVTLGLPLQLALAREVSAAGLTGREAALALRGILYSIGGLLVIAFRSPDRLPVERTAERLWSAVTDPQVDAALLAELGVHPDLDELFEHTIGALVASFIPG